LTSAAIVPSAPGLTNLAAFRRIVGPLVGEDRQFVSVSLWAPGGVTPLDVVGEPPALLAEGESVRGSVLARARADTMTVVNLIAAKEPRLGFAVLGEEEGTQPFIAYGESALPENRTAVTQVGAPYENVDYAVYLGTSARRSALLFADTSRLPLEGSLESQTYPFGDTRIRLEFASRANLAGRLSTNLYWIIAVSGVVLAALAGFTLQWIAARRDQAAALAAENAELYREQRNIAVTLQHSLLPEQLGGIPDVEVVARYEPASARTEGGGAW
jgi:hypothetical protein